MTDHSSPLVLAWDVTDNLIQPTSDFLHGWILAALLLGVGVFFTIRTRCVQLRLFPRMWATVLGRDDDTQHPGISSFQAFATGMASRVGTGNIVGVAIALTLGGPGAIFWMWVVAFVGMATGFVEATSPKFSRNATTVMPRSVVDRRTTFAPGWGRGGLPRCLRSS